VKGWIKLNRSVQQHWIWNDAEYLRAWVAILIEVNHADKKVLINKSLLDVARGESLNSLETWGKKFGNWSKSKTRRFLEMLEKDGMVARKSERITTRLTVLNYSKYQDSRNGGDTAGDTPDETRKDRGRDTNKNGKNPENGKNEKKYNPKAASATLAWIDDAIWAEWVDHKRKVKAAVSERAIKRNIAKLRTFGEDRANELLALALDRGWRDIYDNGKPRQQVSARDRATAEAIAILEED
jgi:hypothetical protein